MVTGTARKVYNLVELFNLLTLLKPGLLKTGAQFKREYVGSKDVRVPKNPEKLRKLMREVMVRNTRSVVDVKLPKRFASTITVQPTVTEKELYQALNQYLRTSSQQKTIDKLTRNNLLMSAGSSPVALVNSLEKLSERLEDSQIRLLQKQANSIKQFEKTRMLVDLLKKSTQKTLVFVNNLATQTYLSESLKASKIEHSQFRGDMSLTAKDTAIADFRELVPVMLATETGGEGRNQYISGVANKRIVSM
ncbi:MULTISPECIES: SNF2-related protein [unclassified Calothrix]|uniref:SNF2-related protein n=1 Tax=unclassified Calothrix TaxID=2619626 RepID=UPI001F54B2AF|nr:MULTISPECIES: SNF2-related protein [unclassified Calothrix]